MGLPIGDTQCDTKLLRNTLRRRQVLTQPFAAWWLFDVELFTRIAATAASSTGALYEYPLPEWTEAPGSKVTVRAICRAGIAVRRLIAERRLRLTPGIATTDLQQHVVARVLATAFEKAD